METDEKVCPCCAEVIKAAAIKCKHCGSSLAQAPAPAGPPGAGAAGPLGPTVQAAPPAVAAPKPSSLQVALCVAGLAAVVASVVGLRLAWFAPSKPSGGASMSEGDYLIAAGFGSRQEFLDAWDRDPQGLLARPEAPCIERLAAYHGLGPGAGSSSGALVETPAACKGDFAPVRGFGIVIQIVGHLVALVGLGLFVLVLAPPSPGRTGWLQRNGWLRHLRWSGVVAAALAVAWAVTSSSSACKAALACADGAGRSLGVGLVVYLVASLAVTGLLVAVDRLRTRTGP